MNTFRLIRALRPINLLMTVFILFSVRYGILKNEEIDKTWFPFYVTALIFVMAFGYLINDYFDVQTDKINKPGKNIFDTKNSIEPNIFMWLSAAVGLIIPIAGFLRNYHWVNLLLIYLFAVVTLFIYAKYLKNSLFFGNLSIAILSSLTIILPCYIKTENTFISDTCFYLISIYSIFAFITTYIREIVKDAEDINGDKTVGIKTLATVFGAKISVYAASVFMVICILLLSATAYYFYQINNDLIKATAFLILAVFGILPLFKIIRASDKKQFSKASAFIKVWMLLGIISMWI